MLPTVMPMRPRWLLRRIGPFALSLGVLLGPSVLRADDPPALKSLLSALEELQRQEGALAKALERLKSEADAARAVTGKAEEAQARLNDKTKQINDLKNEAAKLGDKLKEISTKLAALEGELPPLASDAETKAKEAEKAKARITLIEQVTRALNQLAVPPADAAKPATVAPPDPKPAAPAPPVQPAPKIVGAATGTKDVPAEAAQFFEASVRPILAENCFSCHGPQKQKGGLRLDSNEFLMKGGDSGPVVVPGDPAKSRLIVAIGYADADIKMPPKNKLPQEAIDALTAWIKMGAPWPEKKVSSASDKPAETFDDFVARSRQTHWAFKPVRHPAPPSVANEAWCATPVDRFILAKLEDKGLVPSARADKRTLIRRATYDLTGLPPTTKEIADFEADSSAEAFEHVVDRLLASPRYGERWGRHWLDLARYADTKGYVFQEERRYPFSYTYRDYVIRAFNEDIPYDRFITEQIAADRLNLGEDKRALAAMGFLTLNRRFIGNIHDIIDDRIDVVSRGFMGLTVTCARCHDHKFDPVPSADYYSLYGIFRSSVEPVEMPLIGQPKPGPEYDDFVKQVSEKKKALADFRDLRHRELLEHLRATPAQYMLAVHDSAALHEETELERLVKEGGLHSFAVRRWKTYLDEKSKAHDPIFAPWTAFSTIPGDEMTTKGVELAKGIAANADKEKPINPFVAQAFQGDSPKSTREVADRYGKLFADVETEWGKLLKGTAQVAAQAGKGEIAIPAGLSDPAREALRQVLYGKDSPTNPPQDDLSKVVDIPTRNKLADMRNELLAIESTHPARPPRAMALEDAAKPFEPVVFKRGKPSDSGDHVPRRFLAALTSGERQPFKDGSGRLELARAIANEENPLTARVLVNRVWHWHFGRGFVSTPSDFGLRSDPPTHPELLDYLASRFMKEGWSVKKLHRLIMLSAVYQQASMDDESNRKIDVENRFLWRFNRQRLDFEEMRDSLLVAAGKLDETMGGPAVEIAAHPSTPRRTIYGIVERQNLPGMFRTFDFASPDAHSPARFQTTVPQQALFLMNSPFVTEQVRAIAGRSEIAAQSDAAEQIRSLYELAFSREPEPAELEIGQKFLSDPTIAELPPPPPPSVWQYGYGEYDEAAHRIAAFAALPFFNGSEWRGSDKMPDPALGWVALHAKGGHPGGDAKHQAIRRWIAPRDGAIEIKSRVRHEEAQGDGVRAFVVSSRAGELGRWEVKNRVQDAEFARVEVVKGDAIDFIIACGANESYDMFKWAPRIKMIEERTAANQITDEPSQWSAFADFSGPAGPQPAPLKPIEVYAQAMLLSNEFMFVD